MSYDEIFASRIKVADFSLKHTFESAQPLTFYGYYNNASNTLTYADGQHMLNVGFEGNADGGHIVVASRYANAIEDVKKRFRLEDDIKDMYASVSTDAFMRKAIVRYRGMRVTLNDPWETTLCFIISQFNNVKRIRGIVLNLIKAFGSDIKDDNDRIIGRSFPKSADLLKVTESDFKKIGAGFRARYLAGAAEYCTYNLDLYKLNPDDYGGLKSELTGIKGVGDKVADCIALMGYGNMHAFPIDVWVKRTLEKFYFKGRKKSVKELHAFAEKRWGKYAGFAQQYLFYQGMNI